MRRIESQADDPIPRYRVLIHTDDGRLFTRIFATFHPPCFDDCQFIFETGVGQDWKQITTRTGLQHKSFES